jgi:6-pyruvoyltetrahydropterin/6-carboxytetrahydropterin synthase
MYEITTESSFSAAHCLRNYNGPCENLHGHNWLVRATVRTGQLNDLGIGIDFKELKSRLNEVLSSLDHKELNAIFDPLKQNPSSENIARHIYQKLSLAVNRKGCRIWKIEVFETPGNSSAYFEE